MIDTCFVLEDIKFMDFRVLESALGSQGVLPVADPDRVTRFLEPGQNFQI